MANTTKMTKMQKFQMIAEIPEVANDPVLAEFVAKEMAMLAKKNSGEKHPTAQQVANVAIQEAILDVFSNSPNQLFTISDLMKAVPSLPENMTNQRMSALVHQLVDKGLVVRIEEKRKAYFQMATT